MASAAPVMTWLGVLPGWAARARARARRARAVLAVMMTGGARQAIALGKPGWGQGTAMQAVAGSRAAGSAAKPSLRTRSSRAWSSSRLRGRGGRTAAVVARGAGVKMGPAAVRVIAADRKSTRLNSSHLGT